MLASRRFARRLTRGFGLGAQRESAQPTALALELYALHKFAVELGTGADRELEEAARALAPVGCCQAIGDVEMVVLRASRTSWECRGK